MQAQKAGRVYINPKAEYLRGRVVALAERLQGAEGDEALQIVDELLGAAHQLVEISAGRSK